MNNVFSVDPLEKGWRYFDIMHINRKVARIYESGKVQIYYSSFLPYNIYLEHGDEADIKVNNLVNFYAWCSSRVLTLDRKYAKEIMNYIGASQAQTDKDRAKISITYHGLSLLDVYWIRKKNEKITFDEINLFDYSLSNAFIDVSLRGKAMTLDNKELVKSIDEAADLGTPGVAPKAWKRENDGFYLLKDGDINDVESELLASKIVRCFNVESVKYEEDTYDDQKVSKSKIITSKDQSIVSIEAISVYCDNKDKNTLEFILEKDKYNYYMMNIIDYLVGNNDRHWGNWGFFVDNKKNTICKLYPLMDFNRSFKNYESIEGGPCLTKIFERISQKDAAIEAVKKVGLNQIKQVDDAWFNNDMIKDMFHSRLELLKEYDIK